MADITLTVTQTERQTITVALARLATERPGWDLMLADLAAKLSASAMYEHLKRIYAVDPTAPAHPKPTKPEEQRWNRQPK